MAIEEVSGRIPKAPFEATIATLFALACLSVCARFYIRLRIQKEFSPDDAFLIFGLCCMIVSFAVVSHALDDIFFVQELLFSHQKAAFSFDNIHRSLEFKKLVAVTLISSWLALMSVKFSFLMLFWRLIDRIPGMVRYWWAVVVFNVIVTGYGIAVYLIACPHYNFFAAVRCLNPDLQKRELYFAISQNIPDIIGDLMIVYIPIRLLWKIKVRLTKKLALGCSLCLTLVVICFTLVRAVAINYEGKVDNAWEIFWQTVAAEIALILTAMTAFRALYISRARRQADNKMPTPPSGPASSSPGGSSSPWARLKRSVSSALWRWTSRSPSSSLSSPPSALTGGLRGKPSERTREGEQQQLPSIPGATITHMRTFIDGQGRSSSSDGSSVALGGGGGGTIPPSRGMHSVEDNGGSDGGGSEEREEDEWPLQPMPARKGLIAQDTRGKGRATTMHGKIAGSL